MMNLGRTRELIDNGIDRDDPVKGLIQILEAAQGVLALPDSEFMWSWWDTAEEAQKHLADLIGQVKGGKLPNRDKVSVLFLPTGPLQEVSISSGWGEAFNIVADKFDEVARLVWGSI